MSMGKKNALIKTILYGNLLTDVVRLVIKNYGFLQYKNLHKLLKIANSDFSYILPQYDRTTNPLVFDEIYALHLSICELESIPSEISLLRNLFELVLDNNRLVDLPDELSLMTNLRILHLECNKFTKVPDVLGKMKLNQLYLYGNPLKNYRYF